MNTLKPLSIAIIGGGNRGQIYADYATKHPQELCVVAIVEPNDIKREHLANLHSINAKQSFSNDADFFDHNRLADAVLIASPDQYHHAQVIQCLKKGYHVLLEKPIAQTIAECREIAALAKEVNRIVGVCHVLRYSNCYQKVKEILVSGELGKIMNVIHFEPIGLERMAHAFVRGQWRKEEETGPIIMTKSCHDLDLIQWLIGKRCLSIASYGALNFFRKENAPSGSTSRCTNGCTVEQSCPYSAIRIYQREHSWLRNFALTDCNEKNEELIKKELEEGIYGRCVFHCDNDVIDSQVVSMLFEGNITANFTMSPFTKEEHRSTRILLTNGEIVADEKSISLCNFKENTKKRITINELAKHGGGDHQIMKAFVKAVTTNNHDELISNIEESVEGFRMAVLAEESRVKEQMIRL